MARFCMASLLAIYGDTVPYKKVDKSGLMIFVDVSRYIEAVLTTKNDKDLLSYLEDYALSS